MNDHVTARLRRLVADSGKTQAEIAEALGMSKQQISRFLGQSTNPGIVTVGRVLAAIGRRFADLDAPE